MYSLVNTTVPQMYGYVHETNSSAVTDNNCVWPVHVLFNTSLICLKVHYTVIATLLSRKLGFTIQSYKSVHY